MKTVVHWSRFIFYFICWQRNYRIAWYHNWWMPSNVMWNFSEPSYLCTHAQHSKPLSIPNSHTCPWFMFLFYKTFYHKCHRSATLLFSSPPSLSPGPTDRRLHELGSSCEKTLRCVGGRTAGKVSRVYGSRWLTRVRYTVAPNVITIYLWSELDFALIDVANAPLSCVLIRALSLLRMHRRWTLRQRGEFVILN